MEIVRKSRTLRLGNEKPYEEEHAEAETAVKEERPVASAIASFAVGRLLDMTHRRHHAQRASRHHKVEQPLRRRSKRHIHASQSCGWDLRYIDPAHGTPSELKEGGEQEHAHQREISRRTDLSWDGRRHAHVYANIEHGRSLRDRRPK